MDYIGYLSIYDVSSMLYAGELAKSSDSVFNFMNEARTTGGIPIGGIRHLLRSILYDMDRNIGVVLVFDSKTDKQKLFAEYKSNRERNPKIYVQQLMLLDMVKKLGIPYLKVDGYEADDLVHAAVMAYSPYASLINIYSGDTDLAANLIRENITLCGTASIYPTFDMNNYELNIKKGGMIPYNAVLPYYILFGKPSNNVPAFADSKTNSALFQDYLQFCDTERIQPGMRSTIGAFARWLTSCLENNTMPESQVNDLVTRMGYVFPKQYDGEIPDKLVSLRDMDMNDLVFFLKVFNMNSSLQNLGQDAAVYAPRTPDMVNFINQYKQVYHDGCLAVDNDMSPDDSLFSSTQSDVTTVFDAEDF